MHPPLPPQRASRQAEGKRRYSLGLLLARNGCEPFGRVRRLLYWAYVGGGYADTSRYFSQTSKKYKKSV